ncbi:MAG TPA: AAA domain-containing protein [Polyangiaceae bacterium]|nr:AAA domain-containing protein [Polyangiaceae bacterium]
MSRSSSRPQKPIAALSRAQGDDVLRYWLAALRLEEALQARPAARSSASGATVPRLEHPSPGQDYFKLPLDAALAELLAKETQLTRRFDAELCGFFETWLHGQYRHRGDETELSHLLCFPVVHLPRGELAGLLRCGVRLRFGSGDSPPFKAPTRAERQRGSYPAAPDQARLTRVVKPGEAWPYFVDTRLLRQPLGVPTESIDAFFEALRSFELVSGRLMLALLTTLLETVASGSDAASETVSERAEKLKAAVAKEGTKERAGPAEIEAWLGRLTAAVRRLLEQASSRARVYPVGIVIDGTQAKTTWHLQRELEALVEGERGRWKLASPLGAYLTAQALPPGEAPQRALFPGPALSTSQRSAAEVFWGSDLTAVQGPPGTGKTRLILHLCAEALVRQTEALLEGGSRAHTEQLLITSSNNRAVDNVVEPLDAAQGLPLALRAGSRQSCEEQLLVQLRRTLAWLKRAASEPALERSAHLAREKALFLAQRDAVERLLAPRRRELERAGQRLKLLRELEQCAPAPSEVSVSGVSLAHRQALLLALTPLEKRLQALSKLTESAPAPLAIRALEAHYKRTTKRALPAFTQALSDAQLALDVPLPPRLTARADVEEQLEAWEDAAELGLARLGELREMLVRAASSVERTHRAERLRAELEALGSEPKQREGGMEVPEALSRELFARAVTAREAWAAAHAEELVTALTTAVRVVEQERSPRSLFRSEPEAARALCRLFAIWGSTLLSLGNCFPADLGGVARVVIDEAGQCHPAHAVSALLRAEAALVIGDVHQLSPVVELGADDEERLLRSCRLATSADLLLPYRVHADAAVSSQSLADRAVKERGKLTDHFRCQREIIALSDALCAYGLSVHTPHADRSRHAPYLRRPVHLVDLRGEQARLAGSWWNELELAETLALIESLRSGGVQLEEIAVITPYRGQLEQLRRGFLERRIALESSSELAEGEGARLGRRSGVALGTVHRFQGGERSIVLFSSVVTHGSSLAFLNARPNLLNVAISRAQHHFVCLGHAPVLAQGPRSRLLVDGVSTLSTAAYRG